MKVYYGIQEFQKLENAVVTSGTFDGVHLGHQKILKRLAEVAQQTGGESVVITFYPHPRTVVSADNQEVKLLSTLDEKIELLTQNGVQHLLVIPFTREFSELTSEEFIQKVIINTIGTKTLVIGYDHRFGKNREGGFDYLVQNASRYGFGVEEISRQDIDHIAVSSSKIRKAIQDGDMTQAQHFLGRNYDLNGLVVKGKQIGRTIGFPTANIQVREQTKLVPQDGVYAVWVYYNAEKLRGMLNIGNRPTVDGTYKTIEVNILDFNKEIYGENLKVEFVQKVRAEQKFNGLDALKAQITQDKLTVSDILN
ncbi:bifunctional riboflavin kinase/FAD synthetase [Flectobacillus roseus]|uniref:bifunctional riboflavin kinase/FAD synthetase n=1 Tax=Flectobacillus roseus TaxID=502259 RepID=UPI0014127D18|nr:bifunctional riboflavin kinase/FAD synthetase [Flectobacillus roseus]MDI9871539.1 bifunctional riboflavin kinase/FAD synthetase [Flectobacillus roseus]NBA75729.1 bifunctional riboflavin kinase/FAD synthetase [Emticicia sp. ODNR4P]